MPIEFCTSLDLDLVYSRWWGDIDLGQFRSSFAIYLADRHYAPGRPELIDLSGVSNVDLDFACIRLMLRQVNEQVPGTIAHTVTVMWAPDDETYATGRMYQQLADYAGGITVQIFRRETAALAAYCLPYSSMADLLGNQTFLPSEIC